MKLEKVIRVARRFARPYCVGNGSRFRLQDFDADDTGKLKKEDKPMV